MFNTKQQKAIDTTEGQVILIACPGSGKTTTLLARINHMIETGIDPNAILMVTFTKAAADEITFFKTIWRQSSYILYDPFVLSGSIAEIL